MKGMRPEWPIYKALAKHPDFDPAMVGQEMAENRLIFRFDQGRSYASNVFLRTDYIRDVWGRFLDVLEIASRPQGYQDAVVLRRPH